MHVEFFVMMLSPLTNLVKFFLLLVLHKLSGSILILQLLHFGFIVFLLFDHFVFQFFVADLHVFLLVLYYLKPLRLIFFLSLVHSVRIQVWVSIGETCIRSSSTVPIIFTWTKIVGMILELTMRFLVSCHTGIQTLVSFMWRNKCLLRWCSRCGKLLLKILAIRCSKHFLLIWHAQVHDSVISFALRKNSLWTTILVLNQFADLNYSSLSP